jgi:hypothetical protein
MRDLIELLGFVGFILILFHIAEISGALSRALAPPPHCITATK